MRKISLILTIAIVFSMIIIPQAVSADNGKEFSFFYDFENYELTDGGFLPDDGNWLDEGASATGVGEEDGNRFMTLQNGERSLYFGTRADTGRMHISFKVKFASDTKKLAVNMYHYYSNEEDFESGEILNRNGYAKTFELNSEANDTMIYYFSDAGNGDMTNWNYKNYTGEYDSSEWHRFDIITGDMGASSKTANYYIDGNLINTSRPINIASARGFRTFTLKSSTISGVPDDGGEIYVDDISINRIFASNFSLGANLSTGEFIPMENAEIAVKLTEPVDEALLVKDNIKITNAASQKVINDFNVFDVTEDSFKLKINETLTSGKYNIMLDQSIRGKIMNRPLVDPIQVRTNYITEDIYTEFIEEDFDDYSGTGVPEGWTLITVEEGASNNIGRTTGASGEDGDYAYIDEDAAYNKRNWIKIPLTNQIAPGREINVEFDVKAVDTQWFFDIVTDEGDDLMQNIILGCTNNADRVGYSPNGNSMLTMFSKPSGQDNQFITDVWNNIKIKIFPVSTESTKYEIIINDNPKHEFTVSKDFYSCFGTDIAFSYIPKEETSSFAIDNILLDGNIVAYVPEIEEFVLYDYKGEALDASKEVTSSVKDLKIKFNTYVDEDSIDCIKIYEGDSELSYTYDIDNTTGVSIVAISFDNLLQPSQKYKISASTGIKSLYSSDLVSILNFGMEFSTKLDHSLLIYRNEYDSATGTYYLEISKNNADSFKAVAAVAGYVDETKVENDTEVTYKRLVGIKYIPVIIDSESMGILEYSITPSFTETPSAVKTFLWGYPSLWEITVNGDGVIQ